MAIAARDRAHADGIRALAQVPFDHELADLRAEADLAEAYRDAGRYRDAVATFEQLWPRLVAQGRDDTATAGTWLNNWGVAVAQMGRPLEAERLLRQSMDIHRADASDAALSPMLMTNYAQQLLDLGRLAEAQDYAERGSREREKRAGDEVVINQTLLRLARVYRAQLTSARSSRRWTRSNRGFKARCRRGTMRSPHSHRSAPRRSSSRARLSGHWNCPIARFESARRPRAKARRASSFCPACCAIAHRSRRH